MQLIRKYFTLILLWGFLGALILDGIAFFLPRQYSAESQVLIISRDRTGVDPYTQAKSAERIGENLARVMQTSDFFNKVMSSGVVTFNKDYWLNLSERDKRKEWQRDVQPQVVYNTSLLKITAYAGSKEDVVSLLNAISQTVTTRGSDYIGGDVLLKQVDDPLVSRLPARPNFIFTAIGGFILGCLLCSVWVIYYKKRTIFS